MDNSKRLLELDSLRGVAAIGVVLFHYIVAYADQYNNPSEVFSFLRYFRYGKHGVELFFIISGFVIFMSLERTKNISDFIFSRFSRLYPTYWASIILSFTIISIARLPKFQIDSFNAFVNLTMLQGFLNVPDIDPNYWTLQIELCFYALMIFLYIFEYLKKIDNVAIAWLSLISINYLLEKLQIISLDPRLKTFLILDHAHLFIIGMLLYRMFSTATVSSRKYVIILSCILFSLVRHGVEQAVFVILFTSIFVLILRGYLRFINIKPLLFLGSISYSLYVCHLSLGFVVIKSLENLGVNLNIGILIALVISIIVSTLITFFIEKPAMKFMKQKYNSFQYKRM